MNRIKRIWGKVPVRYRDRVHKLFHLLNNQEVLLRIFKVRQISMRRKLSRANLPVDLRLGESRKFDNWVSSNYQVFVRNFLDATQPYGKNVCRYIFADNVIEHLPYESGVRVLENAYKALVPGGILRITTPDLETIAKKYLRPNNSDLKEFALDLKGHNLKIRFPADFLRITFTAFGHASGNIYDFTTLRQAMEEVGFTDVKKFRPGHSDIPKLVGVESRMGKSDHWSQMSIEGIKPSI